MAGVITEIAIECGVSEQAVRAWCRRNHVAKDAKGSFAISESQKTAIYQHYLGVERKQVSQQAKASCETCETTLIAMLQGELDRKSEQLAVKDKQIEELNARLAEVSSALVTAQQTAAAAQALHAGTMHQQLLSGKSGADQPERETEPVQKRSWFSILRDRYGLNFPTDGITISTVGPVDQLKKLREEHLKIQLTISLHAATQSARNRIIPHMRIYAIEDVVKQALSYSERHNRKIVFAYLLLPGINDRPSDVRQLAKWFRGKKVMINVLQYNPTSNSRIKAPQKREIVAFKHQLEQAGLEVTMRVSHGREINAACGQLANTYNKFKKK